MSIAEEVFDALHADLVAHRPDLRQRAVVLCPVCLREVSKEEFLTRGLEHILPRNLIKKDDAEKKALGTLNQRCGITLLCQKPRPCKSNNQDTPHGCNGMKGRLYDRLFRGLLDDADHQVPELSHRHGVAILVMAYLGAFQYFGYDYILRPELDEIREQFDFPDERRTNWLDRAEYYLARDYDQVVVTEAGTPFLVGGILTDDAPLEVRFRRFRAFLPKGHRKCRGVSSIPLLKPELPVLGSFDDDSIEG